MKVIKCDICGKEIELKETRVMSDFIKQYNTLDLCEKCLDIYQSLESSFINERMKLCEKYEKDLEKLLNKYKKEVLKLRENSWHTIIYYGILNK